MGYYWILVFSRVKGRRRVRSSAVYIEIEASLNCIRLCLKKKKSKLFPLEFIFNPSYILFWHKEGFKKKRQSSWMLITYNFLNYVQQFISVCGYMLLNVGALRGQRCPVLWSWLLPAFNFKQGLANNSGWTQTQDPHACLLSTGIVGVHHDANFFLFFFFSF